MATSTQTTHQIFETRDGAEFYLETLITPEALVAQEAKLQESRDRIAQREESFDRCDTDGFVSQWVHGLGSAKAQKEAEIALHGGMAAFRCLVDLETGELRSTKLYTLPNRFAGYGSVSKWCVPAADGKVQWITDYTREANYAKKGLKTAWIVAPAYSAYRDPLNKMPEPRGLSGACNVHSMTLLDYKSFGWAL